MSKGKKVKGKNKEKDDSKLYEELVLKAIQNEPHRPRAIVRICKILNQNQVVQILNRLEEDGRVERVSNKSWQAS